METVQTPKNTSYFILLTILTQMFMNITTSQHELFAYPVPFMLDKCILLTFPISFHDYYYKLGPIHFPISLHISVDKYFNYFDNIAVAD
jgi:hypothetical protein